MSDVIGSATSPDPLSRTEALSWITSGDDAKAADALTRLALYDADRMWVEGLCAALAYHPSPILRRAVLFCIQHYIWSARELSSNTMLPVLTVLSTDADQVIAAVAQEAIEDYELLVRPEGKADNQ